MEPENPELMTFLKEKKETRSRNGREQKKYKELKRDREIVWKVADMPITASWEQKTYASYVSVIRKCIHRECGTGAYIEVEAWKFQGFHTKFAREEETALSTQHAGRRLMYTLKNIF